MNNTWLAVPETCYSVTEGSQNTGATKSVVRWWETKYRPRREWRWGFSNVRSGWVRVGHVSDSFYYDSIPRFGPVWEKEIVRLSCSALRWCLQLHGCHTGPAWEKEKNEKNETEEECTKPSEWKWSSMDRVLSLLTSRDRLREGRICMDGLIRQPYVTTWKKKFSRGSIRIRDVTDLNLSPETDYRDSTTSLCIISNYSSIRLSGDAIQHAILIMSLRGTNNWTFFVTVGMKPTSAYENILFYYICSNCKPPICFGHLL